ncbi:MAG: winged helix-turn-helix transcriptional regulator [Methanobrevibacter sp.]|uniref:MarR family winged helix-turn-helix transcriptional regulator n=1 Tax=Methanobrevibacter sp. TaxID=66852 RepID=UPI0025E550A4|nr:MarR family winged helix-turn-helix transcriptional regulator [Methanobrevibacter sp.]MBR0270842.1 winged helix-turn-helix transcriptional regulator [Methanobrevibacter sp.]
MKKILIILVLLIVGITAVSAHGVDITADTMVITNNTNGQLVKDIADANGINISVYKFTSEDEVAHILEHSVNNTNKRILLVAYQDTGKEFLNEHQELSDRIIIVDDLNNETILDGLNQIMNAPTGNTQTDSNFGLPLGIGIVIGLIIGLGIGVLISKKKS